MLCGSEIDEVMSKNQIRILIVIGTRPEAIKMAPLISRIRKEPFFHISVCNTGQHTDLIDGVLDFFSITTDYQLSTMADNQGLYQLTASVIKEMQAVLEDARPDMVLVHGDTTTSFAASLAAFYYGSMVGHVEAGLRTYHKISPFPEEINRHLTGVIADVHFAPTNFAASNLNREGITENVFITGNTVVDALFDAIERVDESSGEIEGLKHIIGDDEKKIILFTGHRRENFGQGFEEIFSALHTITEENKNLLIVYPVHPNPMVKEAAERYFGKEDSQIRLIAPVTYGAFTWLMKRAYLIMTDSGGIQEEAPSLGKPVVVLRDTTERPEAVAAGTVIITGTNREKIISTTQKLLNDPAAYRQMASINNPYGDGKAAERIITHLKQFFLGKS